MGYSPREGVDYLVDLYAVAETPPSATTEEIKHALNQRAMEYYPDRLQGLAPGLQETGRRMAILLNRGRHILLDEMRRAAYDQILGEWKGPISTDGTPIITVDTSMRMELAGKTPEEVEALLKARDEHVEGLTGYNPRRLAFLEGLIEQSGGEPDSDLRAEYEDALGQRDLALSLQEAARGQLLGLPDPRNEGYVVALGYTELIKERTDAARAECMQQLEWRALGGVSVRLAGLLTDGEQAETSGPQALAPPEMPAPALPTYFEDQAERVQAIAREREDITEKRIANFEPTYPAAELQTSFREDVAIGVAGAVWWRAKIDQQASSVGVTELPADIQDLLIQGDFPAVIERGFNILTIEPPERLDIRDLIGAAMSRYAEKYMTQEDDEQQL